MTDWPSARDSEPEIIPPDAPHRPPRARAWVFDSRGAPGYRMRPASPPGPLALILLGMGLGAGMLIALTVLLGAILLWLPLIGLITLIVILAGVLRRPARRPY